MKRIFAIILACMTLCTLAVTVSAADYITDRSGWKVTASSKFDGSYPVEYMIDGSPDTYWHSYYGDDGQDTPSFYLTFTMPKAQVISGISYTPRNDNPSGIVTGYNVYVSDSDKGKAYFVASGSMANDTEIKDVSFGFNIEVRTIIFEITEGAYGYGTCAEFNALEKNSKLSTKKVSDFSNEKSITIGKSPKEMAEEASEFLVNRKEWKISVSSEKQPWNGYLNLIDGSTATYWHSDYKDDGTNVLSKEVCPHWIEVVLPEVTEISGFAYVKRSDNNVGTFEDYVFYASETENGELEKICAGTFTDSASMTVRFPLNVRVKKVRLVATKSYGEFGSCAEFNLIKRNENYKTVEETSGIAEAIEASQPVAISTENMSVESDNVWNDDFSPELMLDGNKTTAWHSDANKQNAFPIKITVDLGSVHNVIQMAYVPRNDTYTHNGVWTDFDVYAKETATDKDKLIAEGLSFEVNYDTQTVKFAEPVKARYFTFVINNGENGYATCAELMFYESKSDVNKKSENNYFLLQIGSNVLKTVTDGEVTEKTLDVAPFIDSGSTLIPLRGLFEEMDAEISWDATKRKITVDCGNTNIVMQIDNDLVYVTNKKYGLVRYTLSVYPQIINSRTFVPIRFVSENLGYNVEWNGEEQTIKISK